MKPTLLALGCLLALGLALPALGGPDSDVRWIAGKGVFHTKRPVEGGVELRIRVQKPGKDALHVLRWRGKKKQRRVLRSWDGSRLRPHQVVRVRVAERMRLALQVSGKKDRPPKEMAPQESFHRLRFGGGWVIDVKVVGDSF